MVSDDGPSFELYELAPPGRAYMISIVGHYVYVFEIRLVLAVINDELIRY